MTTLLLYLNWLLIFSFNAHRAVIGYRSDLRKITAFTKFSIYRSLVAIIIIGNLVNNMNKNEQKETLRGGLEPPTSRLTVERASQLRHRRSELHKIIVKYKVHPAITSFIYDKKICIFYYEIFI